jgi:hypothetical protein
MALIELGRLFLALIALAVGVRLLLLWHSTGQRPELLIGLGVLGIGSIGFGLQALALALGQRGFPLAPNVAALGSAACVLGAGAILVFNWRVYHPSSRAVAALVHALLALAVVGYAIHGLLHGFPAGREHIAWVLGRGTLQVTCLLWASSEALRYYGRMRRRIPIGIGDALTANRFLLWAIAAGAAGLGSLWGMAAVVILGREAGVSAPVLVSSSLHATIAAVGVWLAFFPPAAYQRFIVSEPASGSSSV